MEIFCGIRPKTYAHLINGYNDDDYDKEKIINKKAKGIKKCITKRRTMFENYTDRLFNDKIILKSQQRLKSDHHEVYTEEVNKTFDRITTYPHGANAFKVCESEMMVMRDFLVENYADCPFYDEIVLQSQEGFKRLYRTSK